MTLCACAEVCTCMISLLQDTLEHSGALQVALQVGGQRTDALAQGHLITGGIENQQHEDTS